MVNNGTVTFTPMMSATAHYYSNTVQLMSSSEVVVPEYESYDSDAQRRPDPKFPRRAISVHKDHSNKDKPLYTVCPERFDFRNNKKEQK